MPFRLFFFSGAGGVQIYFFQSHHSPTLARLTCCHCIPTFIAVEVAKTATAAMLLSARLWLTLSVLFFTTTFSSASPLDPHRDAAPKPHIISILQDDLGFDDSGIHNPAAVQWTQNITQLARDGIVLDYHCKFLSTSSSSS